MVIYGQHSIPNFFKKIMKKPITFNLFKSEKLIPLPLTYPTNSIVGDGTIMVNWEPIKKKMKLLFNRFKFLSS